MWPQASYPTSLCLSLVIYKMKVKECLCVMLSMDVVGIKLVGEAATEVSAGHEVSTR